MESKNFKEACRNFPVSVIDSVSNFFSMLKSRRFVIFVVAVFLCIRYGLVYVKDINDFLKLIAIPLGVGLGHSLTIMAERRANGNNKK